MTWTRPPSWLKWFYRSSRWSNWTAQPVLFSFDDGPGQDTPALLDLASEYDMKFLFFLLPESAKNHPDIVRRMASEGHLIGTHFAKHRRYFRVRKSRFLRDLSESAQEIKNISGNPVHLCRAPHGQIFPWQEKWIRSAGFQHVFWNLDSQDYRDGPEEAIVQRMCSQIQHNDIVLMHDGPGAHPDIVGIAERILERTAGDVWDNPGKNEPQNSPCHLSGE